MYSCSMSYVCWLQNQIFGEIVHLMIKTWNFACSIFRYPNIKNSRWPSWFQPYSRWPPINKMSAYIFNIVKIFFNSIHICLYWCLYLFFKWPLQLDKKILFVKFPQLSIWPPSSIRKVGVFRYFIALRLIIVKYVY